MAIKAKNFLSIIFPTILFLFFGIFSIFTTAKASSYYTTIWGSHYPHSGTYGAECYICHSLNLEYLNAYGKDICLTEADDTEARIVTIEMYDSDGDGITNIDEIESDAQPGWKDGDNTLYFRESCEDALTSVSAPVVTPRPFQPPLDFSLFLPLMVCNN